MRFLKERADFRGHEASPYTAEFRKRITMQIAVDDEFLTICKQILQENHSLQEWREIESDDMFQSQRYEGGFDATEDAFCFSYYDSDGDELWFQLELAQITEIVAGNLRSIDTANASLRYRS